MVEVGGSILVEYGLKTMFYRMSVVYARTLFMNLVLREYR